MLYKLLPTLALAILAASCNPERTTDVDPVSISDTLKFISLPENGPFLDQWSTNNTLVYHLAAEPDMLHPTNGFSSARVEILQYTQMYLVRTDMRTLETVPALLTSYPTINTDGVSYDCELRNDVTWDDGSPITAADVVFTAKANKCPLTENPNTRPFWSSLQDIITDTTNPAKFKVVMRNPYLYNVLFWSDFPIIQASHFDPNKVLESYSLAQLNDTTFNATRESRLVAWSKQFNSADNSRNPASLVGAGPYQVTSWVPSQEIVLEKKRNHWSDLSSSIYEKSNPEKIVFRINKDPNSQILEFKNMTYDGSNSISTGTLMELLSDSNFTANYHARFIDSFSYSYLAMNNRPDGIKHPSLFDDKMVRKAISMLVPYDELNQVINHGHNKRMIGPVSRFKKDFDTTLVAIPYNFKAATRLLAQQGWRDSDGDGVLDKSINGRKQSFSFILNYHTNAPEWKDYAIMLKETFAKAGIQANLQPMEIAVMMSNARSHDYDMFLGSISQSAVPEDFTQLWHTRSWISNGSNYTGFGTKESDELIDIINTTADLEKRIPFSHKLQRKIYEEQPMVFLFCSTRRNVIHKRFGNAEMYFERPGIQLNQLKLRKNNTTAAKGI
ncbi:MAG: ABC transporter substrate-binding protein [Bacteroidota bacterium]|jgi:peptide/nickel transport system substrate-binding protein